MGGSSADRRPPQRGYLGDRAIVVDGSHQAAHRIHSILSEHAGSSDARSADWTAFMWRHVAASVLGFALGAFALDRVVRHRHGKNYNKWIKEDFDLQWSVIQIVGLARAFSPFSKTIQQVSPQFGALFGGKRGREGPGASGGRTRLWHVERRQRGGRRTATRVTSCRG